MSPRQKMALPFGGGLDRASGPMVADPQSQEDVRNVRLAEGFAHVRLGATSIETWTEEHVIAGAPFGSGGHAILIAYDETSREVRVYRADADGSDRSLIDTWFTLSGSAESPPNVFLVEVDGLMFFAHDEPIINRRAPTTYYDPDTGTLSALTAAWAHGDGIRFRGVESLYGLYLIGWGYGTSGEAHPEYIRASKPLDPTTFELRHYMPVGAKGSPILRVVSNGRTMIVFKASSTWQHVGGDRATFDIHPLDPVFGIEGSRLAVELEGIVYAWTSSGPRAYKPGPEDLSIPLELDAPAPSDLVAEGAAASGFAAYYPPDREIRFHFGQRVYGFQVDVGRWVYHELGFDPIAAILLDPTIASDVLPGSVENLSVSDDSEEAAGTDRDVTVGCDHVDMAGDETLELWAKADGGAWAQNGTEPVGATSPQSVVFEGLQDGHDYELQIRAIRAGSYLPDYDNADPDTWPADSYLAYTTDFADPVVTSEWQRNSGTQEQITLTITPGLRDKDLVIERAEDSGAGYGAYATMETIPAASIPGSGDITWEDFSDDEGLGDPNDWGEIYYKYRISQTAGTHTNQAEVEQWAGPDWPADTSLSTGIVEYTYRSEWTPGSGVTFELYDDYECNTELQRRLQETPGDGDETITVERDTLDAADVTIGVTGRAYHHATAFTIKDWSPYVAVSVNVDIYSGDTAPNSCNLPNPTLPADAPEMEAR